METDESVQILFRTLLLTCRHSNKQLYRAGLQTIDVVMDEIAKCISIQGTKKSNVFRWLLVTLSGLIEDSSSSKNIIVGISGCGHLASSIASLAPKHLVPITRRLIKFASRLESKAKEEREQESIDEQQESNWFARAERRKDIIMNRARFFEYHIVSCVGNEGGSTFRYHKSHSRDRAESHCGISRSLQRIS